MTHLNSRRARLAGGFVDNASALPTTPPAQHQQQRWTFDLSYPADIFTRQRQGIAQNRRPCGRLTRTKPVAGFG